MRPQIVSHPFDTTRFVTECSVELRLECGVERAFKLRARLITKRNEMTAEHVRLGRVVLKCEALRDISEGINAGDRFAWNQRRTAKMVREHHRDEIVDRCRRDFFCQPPDHGVANFRLAVVMHQVIHDQRTDIVNQIQRGANALQKTFRDGTAGGFVLHASPAEFSATFHLFGRRGLAEIVG